MAGAADSSDRTFGFVPASEEKFLPAFRGESRVGNGFHDLEDMGLGKGRGKGNPIKTQ